VAIFPVALIVPAIVIAPIAVLPLPATVAFSIQVLAFAIGLGAVFPVPGNGFVHASFRLHDVLATLAVSVVRTKLRDAGE
jgi:hypothetical protein